MQTKCVKEVLSGYIIIGSESQLRPQHHETPASLHRKHGAQWKNSFDVAHLSLKSFNVAARAESPLPIKIELYDLYTCNQRHGLPMAICHVTVVYLWVWQTERLHGLAMDVH